MRIYEYRQQKNISLASLACNIHFYTTRNMFCEKHYIIKLHVVYYNYKYQGILLS